MPPWPIFRKNSLPFHPAEKPEKKVTLGKGKASKKKN